MIDGIECYSTIVNIQSLLNNSELEFKTSVRSRTGELINYHWAEHEGLFFKVINGKCQFKGSIHKFHNKGNPNDNDFTFQDIGKVIDDISIRFGIDIQNTRINNLEFGVNILYNTPDFLNSLVRYYQGTLITEFKNSVSGVEVSKTKHVLKIYEKALNITRVEIHVNKMQYLTDKGVNIATLSDLKKPENYPLLKGILLDAITGLMVFDLRKSYTIDSHTIDNYCSRDYWLRLKGDRTKKDYHLKRFRELTEVHAANWQQKEILKLVSEKWDYLFSHSAIVPIEKEKENSAKVPDKNNPLRKRTLKIKNTIADINKRIVDEKKRVCPITLLDITMQKTNSKFLNIVGIRYYSESKPEILERLKSRLSKKWQNAPTEIQFREIAHSIRNEYYNPKNNPRNNTKTSLKRFEGENLLFSIIETMDTNKRKMLRL